MEGKRIGQEMEGMGLGFSLDLNLGSGDMDRILWDFEWIKVVVGVGCKGGQALFAACMSWFAYSDELMKEIVSIIRSLDNCCQDWRCDRMHEDA